MKFKYVLWLVSFLAALGIIALSYHLYTKSLNAHARIVVPHHDPRLNELAIFFKIYEKKSGRSCPAIKYNKDFLKISDQYGLDWRLLPALSIRESTCFQHGLYNNYFGVGSASHLEHYNSPVQGIERAAQIIVTKGLGHYGPKDNPDYPNEIKTIENEIK